MGKKKRPYYRIVAADSRAPRNGRFIELVGTYDPLIKPFQVELKEERVFHWLKNGAQPTQTVKNLFQRKGVWLRWDLMKNGADEAKIAEEFGKWELLQVEKEKRLAAKEDEKKSKKAEAKAKAAEEKEEEPVKEEAAPAVEAEVTTEEVAEAKTEEKVEEQTEEPAKEEPTKAEEKEADVEPPAEIEEKAKPETDPEPETDVSKEESAEDTEEKSK